MVRILAEFIFPFCMYVINVKCSNLCAIGIFIAFCNVHRICLFKYVLTSLFLFLRYIREHYYAAGM